MKKKIIAIILGCITAFGVLSGCGQGVETSSTSSENTNNELVFVNYRDIRDLNPHLYAGEMYAQSMLYDTLVSITDDGYEGCLAESWTISEDGRIYTFKIREGVTFSDGTVCDANAILANFNAIIENKERHTWLEMMNLLVGVSAPDENTFVIELSEPYYPMLTELGCIRPFAMISPNCMINGSTKDGVNGYIGTGPYVLTDFVTDEYAVFERNENYWGELPAIEKITVKVETTTKDDKGNTSTSTNEETAYILVESDTIMGHYKYHYEEKTIENGNTKTTKKVFTNEELIGEKYERLKKYLKDKLHIRESDIDTDVEVVIQAANGYYEGEENTSWLQGSSSSSTIITEGKGLIPTRYVHLAYTWLYKYNFSFWYENSSNNAVLINYILGTDVRSTYSVQVLCLWQMEQL